MSSVFSTKSRAIFFAIAAAALYALSAPLSKNILHHTGPTMVAAFLYMGAGIGMGAYWLVSARTKVNDEPLTRTDFPYVLAMIVLDIAAPILLMWGLKETTAATASLLNNFEIVATSLIALVVFREVISPRLWVAIVLVTIASILLSFQPGSIELDHGALLVLAACVCWGVENNCTTRLASKSAAQIVMLKGVFSGLGCVIVALWAGEVFPAAGWIVATMCLGFVSFGLSITVYILAQKDLGAAKTSAYYALAPFIGVVFSIVFLSEKLSITFVIALVIMALATWLMVRDSIGLQHTHPHGHAHSHAHWHGDVLHTHEHSHHHDHRHTHGNDGDESAHAHDHAAFSDREHWATGHEDHQHDSL
ncbi:DMT family transporter [Corynebacterium felinum]|uniref:Drug/metabolite transporter (DMT)-like permease n=1 Tax=Corynebacterium felinum TaxID=131318 RepID=A0ABU2BAB7_9CORY|nr:DMT family transporter [Corynebacterium felinum]MDF5819699.1 DMT family transporter [Corynebacterium felinum]MDR7355584.1 drug/metabolite transporter (DMT)-like permease [Corynebacterium felinum]WJY94934.1 EamA-like transporter family protein [Corynebacterium felinum]